MVGFKAIDHPQLAENVHHEHTKRLAEFNITALTSAKNSWLTNPLVYCICTIDEERNKILGSIRIQITDSIHRLPFEEALDQFDVNIFSKINDLERDGKVAESCGLWCSREPIAQKINLSSRLLCFETMVCKYLNIPHCFALVPNHTLNMCFKAGFKKDTQFSHSFSYPDEEYQSWILYKTPLNMKEGDEEIKLRILINDPHLVHKEEFENHTVIIKYELLDFDFSAVPVLAKLSSLVLNPLCVNSSVLSGRF